MSRLPACGERRAARAFGGLPAAGLAGAVAVLAGCGGPKTGERSGFRAIAEYDHYFFKNPASTESSPEVRSEAIKAEVERLATPSWRIARANIIAAGKDAIPWLIASVDSAEPTHVSLRPVPGPTMPEPRGSWTLGQVSYSVLRDLVGGYGNFDGTMLPPRSKAAWEKWWGASKKGLVTYTAKGTIPSHVHKQKEKAAKDREERYPDVDAIVKKMQAKRAEREQRREQAAKQREQDRLEKNKVIEARKAEKARLDAEKARKTREAAEAAAREAEAAAAREAEATTTEGETGESEEEGLPE